MYIALEDDEEALSNNRFPLSKMKLLKEVEENLTKQHMSEIFLDNGVLDVLRRWLEPTPNNILPDSHFRLKVLQILSLMPIETLHLRESGIGKIVMFFSRRNKEMKQIKNISDDLIFKWSRPILENYRKSKKFSS
jgi:transcription factor SPN1